MEENISLFDLLNVSIGTPEKGAVNFSALHALLHAVLRQLGIREIKTHWRNTPLGDGHSGGLLDVTPPEQDHQAEEEEYQIQGDTREEEVQPGTESQEGKVASPTPISSPAAASHRTLLPRIQSCEDDVTKALMHIQELRDQNKNLKQEIMELLHHQRMVSVQAEMTSAVEKCCHRVCVLEENLSSLSGMFQRYPKPEELSQCVTWDVMHSALLSDREHLQEDSGRPVAPPSPSATGRIPTLLEAAVSLRSVDAPSIQSEPLQQTKTDQEAFCMPLSGRTSYLEAVEALKDISKMREKFSKLEAQVVALEEVKLDQSQLTHVRELITNKGLHDTANNLMDQLPQHQALIENMNSDCEKNVQLVTDVQTVFVQLQAECDKIHENNRCLQEENREKQSHIEKLFQKMEELEERKADKQMVEKEIEADKYALESKVSRLQFDSVTEQLGAMFTELLNKVTSQERDWHKVIDRLSSEMDCKLNRIELDSVKKQLEARWKNIKERLQAQEPLEHDDAAVLRKQLVDRFHCLSCDRPVVKYTHGQHLVNLPSTPGFPAHKSIRPFTVYALEQIRHHYRSERISGLADHSHMTASRNCGGSHTVNSASQRRQSKKHYMHTESEEVDIVGLDGHIYRGRLHAPAVRSTETKLPTISTKDGVIDAGVSKSKDKATLRKPATSPELGHGVQILHPHGAKSAQCSRSGELHSASSSPGRDWPVSALGCVSQSSFTQPSAENNIEPPADERLVL